MMDQSRLKAYFSKKKAELTTLSQKYWNQLLAKPRHEQLLWVFAIEVALAIIFFVPLMVLASSFTIIEKILTTTGVWTLITVLISSPIAFFVWKFRDENTIHQLENQRKDVNLKEFQKIAEWVSGLHLVEDKIVKKTKSTEKAAGNHPSGQEQKTDGTPEMETSHEYGQAGQSRHIPSHSRQDGAVGLQVAAVYMLKPFYCGEHGEGFRKPALNLLTSAWLALFKQLEKDKKNQPTHQQLYPELLSNSPLAIALTEVLLADGGTHLRHHREVFPNLYLPYLNLHLPGLDKEEVLQLFVGLKCRGINLENANLIGIELSKIELNDAKLNKAELNDARLNQAELKSAELNGAKLYRAELNRAKLPWAKLNRANLYNAKLSRAELNSAELNGAKLFEAKLTSAVLNRAKLNGAWLNRADLNRAELDSAELNGVDLTGAKLKGAKLRRAELNGAKLNRAELYGVKFNNAKLDGTELNGAKLNDAVLDRAVLRRAQLREAKLRGVKLNGAYLDGANLYLATLSNIKMDNHTSWRGAVFDTEGIQVVRDHLDAKSLTWVIQAPKLAETFIYTKFRFERDEFEYMHKLPESLTVEALQELNPLWTISRVE